MKATGIVRRIDDLGRVVIPKEIRTSMFIHEGDPLEIYTDNGFVCFKKYQPSAEEKIVECAKYAAKHEADITFVCSHGDTTTVSFKNGKTENVKRSKDDSYDLNVAICYALKKAGYTHENPIEELN